LIAEILFEEKLVLARSHTTPERNSENHVQIDWGDEFAQAFHAAFPAQSVAPISISYGPLALDYILAAGGSGYFRHGFIQPYLDSGRLSLVPNSPEFSYSAYAVHSTKADETIVARMREGLRAAAESIGI